MGKERERERERERKAPSFLPSFLSSLVTQDTATPCFAIRQPCLSLARSVFLGGLRAVFSFPLFLSLSLTHSLTFKRGRWSTHTYTYMRRKRMKQRREKRSLDRNSSALLESLSRRHAHPRPFSSSSCASPLTNNQLAWHCTLCVRPLTHSLTLSLTTTPAAAHRHSVSFCPQGEIASKPKAAKYALDGGTKPAGNSTNSLFHLLLLLHDTYIYMCVYEGTSFGQVYVLASILPSFLLLSLVLSVGPFISPAKSDIKKAFLRLPFYIVSCFVAETNLFE